MIKLLILRPVIYVFDDVKAIDLDACKILYDDVKTVDHVTCKFYMNVL